MDVEGEEEEGGGDFQVDPVLAAAMGFSGFGSQTASKKRKFNVDDGFVDPGAGNAVVAPGTGANSVPTTTSKERIASVRNAAVMGGSDVVAGGGTATAAATSGLDSAPTLEALRHGVRNDRGDMVYFLPSFIQDPWAGLKAQ